MAYDVLEPEAGYEVVKEEKKTSPLIAAAHGLSQGVTLGQGAKGTALIQALIGKLSGAELPLKDLYEQFRGENLSEEEQLKKEHPLAYGAGDVTSYVTPGGSGKLLKGGLTAASGLVKGAGMGSKLAKTAIGTGMGLGESGAIKAVGEEPISEKTPENIVKEAVPQALLGGATAPVGTLAGKGLGWIGGQAGQALSGVKTSVLRDYLTKMASKDAPNFKENIQTMVRSEPEVASQLNDFVQGTKKSTIKEYDQAMNALKEINDIPDVGVRKVLEKYKTPMSPEEEPIAAKVKKWLDVYLPKYEDQMTITPKGFKEPILSKPLGTMSGEKAEALKRTLQHGAESAYGTEGAPHYAKIEKEVAAQVRQDIQDAAKKNILKPNPEGKIPAGTRYIEGMKITADKMEALQRLKDKLGRNIENWDSKAESILNRASREGSPQQTEMMDILKNFDDKWGTDYAKKAEALRVAKGLGGMVGKVEAPTLMPRYKTGAIFGSTLPAIIGGILGGTTSPNEAFDVNRAATYGLPMLMLSSPAMQAQMMKMAPTVGKMFAPASSEILRQTALKKKTNNE